MNERSILEYDFDRSVACWVTQAAHAFERSLNERIAPHGITFRQWQVLGWLALEGELSGVQLAERLRIEPPTLAGILSRMERDGWIARKPCQTDRRRKLVTPTDAALPVWDKIVACAQDVRQEAINGLTREELDSLETILAKVRNNLIAPARDGQTAGASHS